MKAVVYNKYGPPEVLELKEVEKPIPNDKEALVKIYTVSINAADYRSMKMGIIPKRKIFGADIAGRVEAVEKNIRKFGVVVYLTNGIDVPNETYSNRTMIGQLMAPIETSFQIRDSNTKNNLLKLKEYVEFYGGEFITYSLQGPEKAKTDIPLGWALSKEVQNEIDLRAEGIDIKDLGKYIK